MSANLDRVRSINAAWERGDYDSVEWAYPEIAFEIIVGPLPGTRRGIAAMGQAWREFLSTWEDYRVEAEEYRELDDDRVLVLTRLRGRGKASGLELGATRARGEHLFHIADGRVTRLALYFGDRDRAFADVGLAP